MKVSVVDYLNFDMQVVCDLFIMRQSKTRIEHQADFTKLDHNSYSIDRSSVDWIEP